MPYFAIKSSLRKELSDIRTRLPKPEREKAAEALAALCLPLLEAYASVAVYMPIGSEISPLPLRDALEAQGKAIALPVVTQKKQPMLFRLWNTSTALAKDAHNIPAPPDSAKAIVPDAIIVPMLGFTASGFRLGYGAGYYDRTIHTLREQGHTPFCIGIAFDCQEADFTPEAHDEPVHVIITETRIIKRN